MPFANRLCPDENLLRQNGSDELRRALEHAAPPGQFLIDTICDRACRSAAQNDGPKSRAGEYLAFLNRLKGRTPLQPSGGAGLDSIVRRRAPRFAAITAAGVAD
jgi:hypothetical protein